MTVREWLWNVIIAADQLGNAVFRGRPGITLSARAMTAKRDGRLWGRVAYWMLDKIDPGHCERAVVNDLQRAEAVYCDLGSHPMNAMRAELEEPV